MKELYLTMLSVFISAGCFGQGSVVYFTKDNNPYTFKSIRTAQYPPLSGLLTFI